MIEVIHDIEKQKFYAVIDDLESHLEYVKVNNVLNLIHTYVPNALRGKGIASKIVKVALTYAEENNLKIIPSCSYVAAYIQRHKEYEELLVL
ncbi:MAG: GNAT family N-acetyltransferase [Ignavibacteria bacterium RIFOXYB2_FULL_35_12]|nr:MAG: GNAT family N-acetyltransferase [Ignavibacteria bacterium GWA2_36_19]OGU62597.1 MAG: GNAT family N-acetyltransferase [Ignavibacteria bacterium GWF2_35_20]OGU79410.1 MAG: GNAT family N-acetyltransferase [Ignavibacteria bacterium RIFOXYA2_FULL_35_9]OGU89638.1 MAG: GNAT family N-acetyltransferase [Ignavibacteria bacterium RIFOXYA12_FULL_35_25]OGU94666.1 MAG: GNAT family N-acetyltransferase [Ignavibacteria bacterium RIFOXYB12_FULL_35_14]OGV01654.1 MAG: GNAT family N-acetyltransferase [Igna